MKFRRDGMQSEETRNKAMNEGWLADYYQQVMEYDRKAKKLPELKRKKAQLFTLKREIEKKIYELTLQIKEMENK